MAKFTDVISGLTESTDPQGDSDYLVGYDGSAVVKYLINNLPFATGSSIDYILLQDQKAQNTAGGTAASPGWQTHVLNTEVIDTGNNASLSSNQITLAAGTYVASGWMRAYKCAYVGWKLYNISDSGDLTTPVFCFVDTSDDSEYPVPLEGYFTIAAEKTIDAEYQCSTARSDYGLGNPSNLGTEIYLSLWLTKVA